MGMSQGDGLTLELLCFPHRDYTEDGQVKTERKYSYSEYRPLFSRATSQACGQMLVGKGTEPGVGVPGCWCSKPCSPITQRGSRSRPFSSRMVTGLDKWTLDM